MLNSLHPLGYELFQVRGVGVGVGVLVVTQTSNYSRTREEQTGNKMSTTKKRQNRGQRTATTSRGSSFAGSTTSSKSGSRRLQRNVDTETQGLRNSGRLRMLKTKQPMAKVNDWSLKRRQRNEKRTQSRAKARSAKAGRSSRKRKEDLEKFKFAIQESSVSLTPKPASNSNVSADRSPSVSGSKHDPKDQRDLSRTQPRDEVSAAPTKSVKKGKLTSARARKLLRKSRPRRGKDTLKRFKDSIAVAKAIVKTDSGSASGSASNSNVIGSYYAMNQQRSGVRKEKAKSLPRKQRGKGFSIGDASSNVVTKTRPRGEVYELKEFTDFKTPAMVKFSDLQKSNEAQSLPSMAKEQPEMKKTHRDRGVVEGKSKKQEEGEVLLQRRNHRRKNRLNNRLNGASKGNAAGISLTFSYASDGDEVENVSTTTSPTLPSVKCSENASTSPHGSETKRTIQKARLVKNHTLGSTSEKKGKPRQQDLAMLSPNLNDAVIYNTKRTLSKASKASIAALETPSISSDLSVTSEESKESKTKNKSFWSSLTGRRDGSKKMSMLSQFSTSSSASNLLFTNKSLNNEFQRNYKKKKQDTSIKREQFISYRQKAKKRTTNLTIGSKQMYSPKHVSNRPGIRRSPTGFSESTASSYDL